MRERLRLAADATLRRARAPDSQKDAEVDGTCHNAHTRVGGRGIRVRRSVQMGSHLAHPLLYTFARNVSFSRRMEDSVTPDWAPSRVYGRAKHPVGFPAQSEGCFQ